MKIINCIDYVFRLCLGIPLEDRKTGEVEHERDEPEEWGTGHPFYPWHTDDSPSKWVADDPYEAETILGGDGR